MREVGTIGAEQVQLDACPHLTFAFEILGKRWSALILDLLASRSRDSVRLSEQYLGYQTRC